ncbi:hypothetical protein DUI87_24714 [Hirundo rustica rustica]|uniref:DNA polymerase epsilon subunit 2 n=1 Tax=Hirundo rustica rustica TaxID=333673 RepID=A0A3M0JDT8_HIRRU|nr:hypothetical protein DUI87_24714 [Hirundo rustica rustica]
MEPERLRRRLSSAFRLRGLLLRPDALKYLTEAFQSTSEGELDDIIENVIDAVEKQSLSSNMIEQPVVEAAVQECSRSPDEAIENVFNIIGAFDIPRYIYNSERKKFLPLSMTDLPGPSLFGTPRDKAELFRERYSILQQRTHRHELFTPSPVAAHPDDSKSKFQNPVLCGALSCMGKGTWRFDLILIGSFAFDPQLKTVETLLGNTAKVGEVIVLGMITQLKEFLRQQPEAVKASAKLKQLEEENEDAMFVFVSDVWLDQAEVLEKLRIMFSGSLKALADIICEHPSIHKSSRFVFVPGPEDPGPGSILPRIQYCTQEIIIFREDLVNKMCRNCVRFPSSNMDIPNHFVKTILSQGHLSPLPLYVSPVFWAYDYSLRVYPVPDVLVTADKHDPFTVTNTDCLCINPGSFPRSGFSFKVFYPSNKTVEDSGLIYTLRLGSVTNPERKAVNLEIANIHDGKHNPKVKGEVTALPDFQ